MLLIVSGLLPRAQSADAADTLRVRVLRGGVMLAGQDYEGCEEWLRDTLTACEGALGASHAVTVGCRDMLGRLRDAWLDRGNAYAKEDKQKQVCV